MFKSTIFITLLLFTMSCGYEPLNSKKNKINGGNFSIAQINFIGDREINIKIKEKLSTYSNNTREKNYTLNIESESLKRTIAKDIKGNPSLFNLSIKIIVQLKREDNTGTKFIFNENFKYNNNEDKFEMKRYEREIKHNLAQTISNSLITKLSILQ
jgi:predicted oxidoreductase (fatty acid repression mutant protein)